MIKLFKNIILIFKITKNIILKLEINNYQQFYHVLFNIQEKLINLENILKELIIKIKVLYISLHL
jgi:hypothetical protein